MEKNNLEYTYISKNSGGYISKNNAILKNIDLNNLNISILNYSIYGTPIYKLGKKGRKFLILAGIHGNELPPQIAALKLINELIYRKLKDTIYIIPFAAPKSSMMNIREYNNIDLNRSAHKTNCLSNLIIKSIKNYGIDYVGDFHSTALGSNPGYEAIFSTKKPTFKSILIAKHISESIGSKFLSFSHAGKAYNGAIEDECNLIGVPAITAEVLCPFNKANNIAIERSLLQMKSFLNYFNIIKN